MCELEVILDGKKVFGRCIYAKIEDNGVVVKDIMGFSRGYLKTIMKEIDIGRKTLKLQTKGK